MKEKNENLTQEIAIRNKNINVIEYFNYLPDPDPILRKMGKDVRAYRELLIDSQVWACYQSRKSGVLSKEWAINRGKARDKNAEIIENIFKKIDINKLISDILETPFYGFQPIEIIWEYKNSLILPRSVTAKPQEWFRFDNENNLVLRTSFDSTQELPDKKFLCPVSNSSYLNPYGEKVMSRCFWNVVFKKGGLKFWTYFTEKYGMPVAVGTIDSGQSQEEVDAFADKLNAMVQDAVIVISKDKSVEFKESTSKAGSAGIYKALIDHCDSGISKAILGQTLTTEIGSSGSYAASNTHFQVRQDLIENDKNLVEKTINQLIDWIYELNWQGISDKPVFEMWEEDDVDKTIAERDEIVKRTNPQIQFTKKYLMSTYGYKDDDIDLITPAESFSEFQQTKKDEIQELLESIDESGVQRQAEEILKPIMTAIEKSKNTEEAMELLAEAYPDMKTKKLEEVLARLIYISEIFGRLEVQNVG